MREPLFWGGNIPWVSPKDMKRFEIADSEDHVTEAATRRTALTSIPEGSVLLVVRGMILARRVPVAVTAAPVTVNQDMKAIIPHDDVNGRFLAYALLAAQGVLSSMIDEAGHGTKRLPTTLWRDLPVWLPPREEQDAIVRFLEEKERDIEHYLATKRRMIEGLESFRVQAISAFVRKASQTTSGESCRRLRDCVDVIGGMTPAVEKQEFWGGDIAWVSPKDMKKDVLTDSIDHITTAAVRNTSLRLIPRGSVLLVVRGMILARTVPVAVTDLSVTVNQDMKALVPRPGVDGRYLANVLGASQDLLSTLIDEAGHGTKRLPTQRWRDLWVFLPKYEEQLAVVVRAEECRAAIDQAIGGIEREITAMEEYRTRLIADAVTGQIDVRRLA